MGDWARITGFLRKDRGRLPLAAYSTFLVLVFGAVLYTRFAQVSGAPTTYLYLEVGGSLLCFCYAANALVRFRGTHDRIALILAFGFVLSGMIETIGYFGLNDLLHTGQVALSHVPMGWMVGRTLLAVLLLAALAVERFLPTSRQPSRETAGALFVVAAAAYITSAAFIAAPATPIAKYGAFFSRPWELLPGGLFALAAIFFYRRYSEQQKNDDEGSLYDYSLFLVALLNTACHLAAIFSRRLFDGPFFIAELTKVASYAIILCGALIDQARLFDQVRSLAISDPLTGLANYRRLIAVIESELDRSRRTRRPFSIVLLDMDGLKVINDRYGHLVGSRALVRLGKILRNHSRAIDTPARYGGDEFALVLPEAAKDIAQRVSGRVRERLAVETEEPPLSVSAGTASFPEDGDTAEKLLGAADRSLYRMKHRGSAMNSIARIAACL
ncbi:MAG TPA: GGDEF domain-containing protein [Candidatus Eremiobacteraceae bacterium]|nr:GGDEF domain-containing protein [Candidatus Eremiobacteraceae bacterium]